MKILGYLLSLAGIAGLALTTEQVRNAVKITLPEQLSTGILTTVSGALIVVGVLLLIFKGRGSGKQPQEVPIYAGNKIVGYRRV